MKYFTIPLLIVLYLVWSYYSINDIVINRKWDFTGLTREDFNSSTGLWISISISISIISLVLLNVLYWES